MMENNSFNELKRNKNFSLSITFILVSFAALHLPFFQFVDLSGTYFLSLDQIKTGCMHTYNLFNQPCDYAGSECAVYHAYGRNCLFLWGMQIFFGFILSLSLIMFLACLLGVLLRRVKKSKRSEEP
jgi:hypothetical protein